MRWLIPLLFASSLSAQGVLLTGAGSPVSAAVAATPGFVSAVSKQQVTVGTVVSGICATNTICTPYAETILNGNIALDFFTYNHSGSLTVTDTNDKSDSYTCANGSAMATTVWIGYCISAAPTTAAHISKVNFTAATTLSSVQTTSWYNTNGTLDGSIASCTGSATTTINCGSVTTTVANDLIVVFACTNAAHTFTAGTGYTLAAVNAHYGCVSEYKVNTGTGSVTPSITVDSSTSYTEIVLALKANSQGVQPSSSTYPNGWVSRICGDTNAPAAGAFKVQCPNSGNFILDLNAYGSGQTMSSITDAGQSGGAAFAQAKCGNSGGTDAWTSSGAAVDASGIITLNNSGTGDGTYTIYDVSGAPSSPNISCSNVGNGTQSATATLIVQNASNVDLISFLPTPTTGLSFATVSEALNTSTGASTPSVCLGDMALFGGESLDGPTATPGDENNGWMHCNITSLNNSQYAFTMASSSETGNSFTGTIIGVYGTGATAIIDAANARRTTAGSTLAVPVHSTKSGATAVVGIAHFNSTGRTVSSVAFTNGTGGTSAFTQCTSCSVTTTSNNRTDVWINTNEPSGATSLTITLNLSASQLDGAYLEVLKGTGGFAEDVGGKVSGGTGNSSAACASTGTFDCGASVTTTGTVDLVVASFNSANAISACPQSANEFSWATLLWNVGNDGGFCALVTTTAAAHRPIATDAGSGSTFSESTEAIK